MCIKDRVLLGITLVIEPSISPIPIVIKNYDALYENSTHLKIKELLHQVTIATKYFAYCPR